MWKQVKTTLSQFSILASVCLAACPVPDISSVNVTFGKVQWEGSYNESCLREFEVCWSVPSAGAMSCEGVPPNFTSLTIKDVQPCARVTAQVSAITDGLNDSTVVTAKGEGYAGLPKIADLKVVTSSRNFLWLKWSPLSSYACVGSIHVWVCDNAVQGVWSCILKEMPQNFTSIRLYDYDFPVCLYYYVFVHSTNGEESSLRNGLLVYISSDNKLTDTGVLDITPNSAVIQYWLAIVDHNCTKESFQMCYAEEGHDSQQVCENLQMNQLNSTGRIQLTGLNACSAYWAKLSLQTPKGSSYSTKLTFNTARGDRRVLDKVVGTAYGHDVTVAWTTSNTKAPCVSLFFVSWNSTADSQIYRRSVNADARSYAISTLYSSQTVFIEVTAVFMDGSQESLSLSLFLQVYVQGLPGSASHLTASIILLLIPVIMFVSFFAPI